VNTSELRAALQTRHPPEAWALAFEVADGTGATQRRWADAVAMSLWPSRGLKMHGFEIKASRSDWLRELKNPAKSEAICKYCDYWWLVAGSDDIVWSGELPDSWGLLVANKNGVLHTKKQAPARQPESLTPHFLAALLRAIAKPTVLAEKGELLKEHDKGYKIGRECGERLSKHYQKNAEELQQRITAFEAAAGFSITSWKHDAASVGLTVKDVLAGKYDRDRDDLAEMLELARGVVKRLEASPLLQEATA